MANCLINKTDQARVKLAQSPGFRIITEKAISRKLISSRKTKLLRIIRLKKPFMALVLKY